MLLLNPHPDRGLPLLPVDAGFLDAGAADRVERYLSRRADHAPTPMHSLAGAAGELGIGELHVKDEGARLGLGSFKALGGSFALVQLVLEEAERRRGRPIPLAAWQSLEVREIAAELTFGCATDGNHGRSVAAGARLAGARAVVFVHAGVSPARAAAIAGFGAEVIRVPGSYDDSVAEAARRCAAEGWTVLSDTSWPGYERIPGLVMQGYTVLVREALRSLDRPPTHVFVQAGVGGLAAAVAGHLLVELGTERPRVVVVEPARAACVLACAAAGAPVRIPSGEPTVMAMLECYEASGVAWRVLARAADAFCTVDENEAVSAMRRLARPEPGDPPIVAGESGGVGLAGLVRAAGDPSLRRALGLDAASRVLVINTEGATDPDVFHDLVGARPEEIAP